jgi:hypothetical protein
MKTIVLSVLMTLFITTGFSQTFNFTSNEMCSREKSSSGTWTTWTDWVTVDVKIDLNLDKDQVIIHINSPMKYVITEYKPEAVDADGDTTYEFVCTDPDGVSCRIRLVFRKSQNDTIQLYIDYPSNMFAFNLKQV